MKEKRSIKELIFGKKNEPRTLTKLQMLNGYDVVYTNFRGDTSDSKVARQCIDRIATHCAKLMPKHIKETGTTTQTINGEINFLLQHEPNPLMTKYDFIYKIVSILLDKCNVFIYKATDRKGMITGFYPVVANEEDLLEDKSGQIFLRFKFINGQTYTLPYEELIHLRRFYNENDIFGTDNKVLRTDLETAQTSSEGLKNAIILSSKLKGLLHYENSLLKPADVQASKDRFVRDYLSLENKSGIVALDGKADFKEINIKPITLDSEQMKIVNNNIYDYFGISEAIVQNNFNATQWNAFYEGVVEPIAIQMSDAFTNKIFTKQAIKNGNKIIFTANRLQYANIDSKIKLLNTILPYGLVTKDTALEVLDLPILGGDEGQKILQSLNNIDSSIANQYQSGDEKDE